jgi:hypothetical protein
MCPAVTIFLGIQLHKTGLRRNWNFIPDWVAGGYVAAFFITAILMEYVTVVNRGENGTTMHTAQSEEMKLTSLNGPMQHTHNKLSNAGRSIFHVILIVLFTLVALAVLGLFVWWIVVPLWMDH